MTEEQYDLLMEPYVDAAFSKIDWTDSLTARLLIATKSYRECVRQLEADTGHTNPRPVGPDMIKLIRKYMGTDQ